MSDGSEQLEGLAEEFGWTDEPADDAPDPNEVYDDGQEADAPAEEAAPARDYEAELAAERQRADAAAQRAQAYEQNELRRQQYEAQTLQQQWNQAQTEAKAYAKTLPYEEAIEYMDSFRAQREAALTQWGTDNFNRLQQTQITQQAEKIAKTNGLSEEDTQALVRAAMTSGDPNAMQTEAARLKGIYGTKDQEISALKARLERLEKQGRQQQRAASGLNRVGGSNGRPLPRNVEPGSADHLRAELGDDFLRQFGS